MIGSNHLPECLRDRMAEAPVVVVEDPFEIRLERLREEYFDHMWADFLPPTVKKRAGKPTANTCITACSPSAVVWGCNDSRNLPRY